MTELDPSTPEGAAALRTIRRRLAGLLGIALVLGVIAATVVAVRSGHEPSAATTKAVPVDVSCPTATRCVVVDDLGNAITYDDGTWSAPKRIDSNGMNTVSCPTTGVCVAADDSGAIVRTIGDGRWSAPRVIDDLSVGKIGQDGLSSITVVSCATPDFCMAGDVLGRVDALDGVRDTLFEPIERVAKAAFPLERAVTGLDCTSTTFCAAVTDRGKAIVWNGQGWQPGTALTSLSAAFTAQAHLRSTLADVSCTSASFCLAVDPTGEAYAYDGQTWSKGVTMDPDATRTGDEAGITAVSCATPAFCVAVDDNGFVVGYNGTTWSAPKRVDPILGLNAVACPTSSFCVALDDIGEALLYNGSSWTAPHAIDP